MGERPWSPGKNLSRCCLWGMGGSREQRKRKPESGASGEKGTGLGVISQVGSHKSRGRTEEKADGGVYSTFSQLRAVMGCRAGDAGEKETDHGGEGGRQKGAKVIGGFAGEMR